jgi:hypothetical protein
VSGFPERLRPRRRSAASAAAAARVDESGQVSDRPPATAVAPPAAAPVAGTVTLT